MTKGMKNCCVLIACVVLFCCSYSSVFSQQIKWEKISLNPSEIDEGFYDPFENSEAISSYDSLGRLTHLLILPFMNESEYFYSDGKLVLIVENSDNSSADSTKIHYSGDTAFYISPTNTQTIIYDQQGREIEITNTELFQLDRKFEYSGDTTIAIYNDFIYGNENRDYFDSDGNLIRRDYYEDTTGNYDFELQTISWSYRMINDDHGNWIKREMLLDGEVVKTEVRELNYY